MMAQTTAWRLMVNMHQRRPKRALTKLPIITPNLVNNVSGSIICGRGSHTCSKPNKVHAVEQREPNRREFVLATDWVNGAELANERRHGLGCIIAVVVESIVHRGHRNYQEGQKKVPVEGPAESGKPHGLPLIGSHFVIGE